MPASDGSSQPDLFPEAIDSSTKHLAAAVAEQICRPRLHVLGCRLTWFTAGGFSGGIFRPLAQTLCKMPLPTLLRTKANSLARKGNH